MRENRPQEKGDQSLYFRRGRAGARGRPVGGRRDDGGHGEWPDIGRTRHDVAAYKPHRGTLGSSSTACGRRTGRHRKSSGKCPTGNVAHVAGPVDRKRSPAACESRGLDNGKPYVSVFRKSTAGDRVVYGRRIGTRRCHGRVPCPSRQQHHTSGKLPRRVPGDDG